MKHLSLLIVLTLTFVVTMAKAVPTDASYILPNFSACSQHEELCTDVARYEHYVIVRQPMANCPAGHFYLVDNNQLEITGLDAETCSPNVEWKFQAVGEDPTPMAVLYLDGKPYRMYNL
jgi:hypothetical protein